jgi:type IV pilus assembly protein PilW
MAAMTQHDSPTNVLLRRRQGGMTLIELMVSLAIGMFLMIGAVTVFMQGRTTFRVAESVARLQENARFALDTIEPDIRMAQYLGRTNRSTNVEGRVGTTVPAGIPTTCGNTWVHDLVNSVAGTNNRYTWACAGNAPVETNADTLVVRRVTEDPILAGRTANTVYIQSSRFERSQIFVGTALPAEPDPATSQPFRLVVNGYYVSRGNTSNLSTATNAVPSLRMKTLIDGGTIVDREVLPGIEDFQIQFGIDTSAPKTDGRGTIDRYVNPEDAILTDAAFLANQGQILAVRVWLRVRAERLENGFTDTVNYEYADQDVGPFNDGYRRLVVSKTIFLRNANFS